MNQLKFKTKVVHEINYNDWDFFVKEHYNNKKYDIVAAEELNNYMSKEYSVKKKEELDKWNFSDLKRFKAGEFVHGITNILFQDLVNNNIIPEGDYLIDVFW